MQIENKSGRQRARFPENECNDDCFWTEIVAIAVTVVIHMWHESGTQRKDGSGQGCRRRDVLRSPGRVHRGGHFAPGSGFLRLRKKSAAKLRPMVS